jgi:signal transduction histidine kinase
VDNPVEPGLSRAAGSGRGLAGMYERVAAIGGGLRAGPAGRDRFTVRAELPAAGRPAVTGPAVEAVPS